MGLAASLLLVTVGCNPPKTAEAPTTASKSNNLTVGIVFDSGGIGDQSFNDSAWQGAQKAEKELGATIKKVESKSEKDYETNLTALADESPALVVAVGMNMKTALDKIAPNYPNVRFALVDDSSDQPNVRGLKFKEEEGSFLVGYVAGLMTKTNKIGFVGGMKMDLIRKFQYGYWAGARAANPKVELLPEKFVGSWDNVDMGKAAAMVLFNDGADIVYHAAGRAGMGVIRAAKDTGKYAIGVDQDQDGIAEGFVLTSMVKRVDQAVFQTISDIKNKTFTAGVKVYDLKAGGVGCSEFRFTKDKIGAANLKKIEAMKQAIIDGKVKPPATESEYNAFKP